MNRKMELRKRFAIFLTFICFSLGIALLSAALATEHWIEARPVLIEKTGKAGLSVNSTGSSLSAENLSRGIINDGLNSPEFVISGLFSGTRSVNFHLGARKQKFYVFDEMDQGVGFMSLGIWVCVIIFCALAIFWALIGIVFSLINTVMKPIETITGPLGLYVWSSLAAFCGFVSVVLFVVQYFTTISQNVLLEVHTNFGFRSEGHTWLGYSFWLVVSAVCCFLFNIFLLLVSGMEMKTRYPHSEKEMPHISDGGVLMY